MGTVLARHLVGSDAVRELVVADVDEALGRRTVHALPGSKARAVALDAGDPSAVGAVLKGMDVVVNATIPRFNATIQRAALEQRVDYLDLASASSDPFVDGAKWTAAATTAVIGMGEDPGISNLLARHATDRMDRVEAIRIRDGDTATSAEYPFICLFSPETFIAETLHTSRVWRAGRYEQVPPFGEPETYDFPAPVGPQPVYSVDHEEVDTLPRFIGKGVRYVDFKLALDDRTVRTLRTFQDLKLFDPGRADLEAARRALVSIIPKPADLVGKVDGNACLVVEVDGEKSGEFHGVRLHATLDHQEAARRYGATATAYFTGTAGAVGAILLASGRISAPGMHSPETLDPSPFLTELAVRGIVVKEEVLSAPRAPPPAGR